MHINRHNYETFFLLYADNELCAEERLTVESYVAVNEDLRGELNMIMAAILRADDCTFTQKESLYKNSFVDGSLQEKLLLKIDNELSAEELTALNKSILANQAATKEEHLLLATKLDAAEILTCPKKELLYKKERNTVILFRMLKWAAAAIFIGFGLFFGFSVYNKKVLPNNIVAVKKYNNPTYNEPDKISSKEVQNVAVLKMDSVNSVKENNNKLQNVKASTNVAVYKKDIAPKELVEKIIIVEQKEMASIKGVQKTVPQTVNIDIENVSQPAIASITKPEKLQVALSNENIVPLENAYAQAVSFTDNETSNNKILYMDEEDVKRSKVGSVFKKFKRMIERTAKIKTGNPIRIAGFEFGVN